MVLKLFVKDEDTNEISEKYFQFLESENWTYEIHFNTLRNDKEVLLYILNFNDVLVNDPNIMKTYEKLRSFDPFLVTRVQIYSEGYLHFDSQSLQLTYIHCSGRLNGMGKNDFGLILGFYNHIYSEEELEEVGEEVIIEEPPVIEPPIIDDNGENNENEPDIPSELNPIQDLGLNSNIEQNEDLEEE